jgi:two-component system phosphate regulon sensor histidine kinase PhoR
MNLDRRGLWVAAICLAIGAIAVSVLGTPGLWLALALGVIAIVGAFASRATIDAGAREAASGTADLTGLPGFARSIFDPIPDPVMLLDGSGRALFANRAMRDVLGTDVERKPVSALLRTPSVLEAIARTQASGEPQSLEFAFRVPVERFYQAYVARTATTPPITVLVLHDLTIAKRTEQMRADFVANASHELRTPLAAVSGFIDTLRGHARDDAEAREKFLGIMSVEAGRMRRLIEDLLSLTRIELNEHVRPSTEMRLEDAVRDASAALGPLAGQTRIEVGSAAALPSILGERDELIQLFQNLIHNAIKYGAHKVQISFGVTPVQGGRQAEAMVWASVRDDGEGIPADAVPRLTERFYRVDVKRSREQGGTGLGLAIVKHILNRHQGRLQIESKLGEGSTFTVYLPAAAV